MRTIFSEQQQATNPVTSPAIVARMDRFAAWPVVLSALVILVLSLFEQRGSFEHPFLLVGLNFVFSTLVSLAIAALIGRCFVATGQPGLLLLGLGALIWGVSTSVTAGVALLIASDGRFYVNTLSTIHNICAWLAAFCHLTGTAISCRPVPALSAPRFWLTATYLGGVALVSLVALATLSGATPLFFQPDQGGTLVRQVVLASAITMFCLAALLLHQLNRKNATSFARWYGLALFLFAIGLVAVLLKQSYASLVGWAGRAAQYLGGLYMLLAMFRSRQGVRFRLISLEQVAESAAQRFGVVVAIAVASSAASMAVRLFFLPHIDPAHSFMAFVPAVMLASFLGGFRAGLMTILFSALMILSPWNHPFTPVVSYSLSEVVNDVLFLVSSFFIAWAALKAHRAETRVALAEVQAAQTAERERLMALLQVNEARLANVIDGTGLGLWDWHVATGEVVFNERWAEIVGYTLADLAPISIQTWIDLAHPDDLQRSRAQLTEVFAHNRPRYDIECRMKHRQGHWVWVHDRGRVIEWSANGKPLRMTGSHTDITGRKMAEARLNEMTREQRVILETIPMGIVKVVGGKVVWSNPAFAAMLNTSQEELLSQPLELFLGSDHGGDGLEPLANEHISQDEIHETERRLVRRDGLTMLLLFKGRAIDPTDPTQGTIWVVEDITLRRQAEEFARDRAALYQAMFACNRSVQLLIDPSTGAVIDANEAAADYYGYGRDYLQSINFADINILSSAELREAIVRALDRRQSLFAFRQRLASGELREVEAYLSSIVIEGQALLHVISHDITEQKRLEDALRANQELLRSVTEGTSDAVYIKDRAGRYLMCNTATTRYVGKPAETIVESDDTALMAPDDAHRVMAGDRQVMAAGVVRTYEEHMTLHGSAYTFLATKGPVRNALGEVIGLFGIARDISERKLLEERLREQEANLRNLIETTSDLIVVATLEGAILFTNARFRDRLGYSREDLATMHLLGLHPPGMRREAEAIVVEMLGGERSVCPLPLLSKGGRLVPVETRAWVGEWNGRDCLVGFIKDLSAEQEAQQRFERLFHSNPASMALLSLPDRKLVAVNQVFLSLSGYAEREVIGKAPVELALFHGQSDKIEAVIQTVEHHGRFANVELQATGQNGVRFDGLFSGEVISSQGKEYLLVVMIDITARKRMEAELQDAKDEALSAVAAQDKLLATVAHEFRTPLALLQSSLEILDRYGERLDREERNVQSRHIRNAARQLMSLANTALTYKRKEQDAAKLFFTPCEIARACRGIAEETEAAWARGHRFAADLAVAGKMLVDERLFRSILENLLANAFQYTPPGRSVFLEVIRVNAQLRLTIADEGLGIAEEECSQVFKPLFRGDNVGQQRGMGLGLSIVLDAVRLLGGTIDLTSAVGRGTVFVVTIPWREEAPDE